MDFLIPPLNQNDKPSSTVHLEPNFGATVIPGADLAHIDFVRLEIEGVTLDGAYTTQRVKVCGPAAYLVLKGLAMGKRGKNKDDYDAFYVVQNYLDVDGFSQKFAEFIQGGCPTAIEALKVYRTRFEMPESVGPVAVSQFMYGEKNLDLMADVSAYFRQFVERVERSLI